MIIIMDNIEKLIENKRKSDRRQRIFSLVLILTSLVILFLIFIFTKNTKENNLKLESKLDTTEIIKDSIEAKLNNLSEKNKTDIIECIGVPTGGKAISGIPLYDFTICIIDSTIISSLNKVEYFFADDTYNPKLKISENASNNFSIKITNSWGCMSIVPVYLYYKNNNVDTINFPMCDKAKLKLPELE